MLHSNLICQGQTLSICTYKIFVSWLSMFSFMLNEAFQEYPDLFISAFLMTYGLSKDIVGLCFKLCRPSNQTTYHQ